MGSGPGAGGDGTRRWAAVDSSNLAENGRPGSVSSMGCTGRTRVLWGTHLGAWVGETWTGAGCTAAVCGAELRRGIAHVGRWAKGPAMLLTVTWSSYGTCLTVEGGRAAARRVTEVRRRWAGVATVCEARAAAVG
jgi:hypothetical protein